MTSDEIPLGLLDAYLDDELTPFARKRVVAAIVSSRTAQGRLKELQLVKRLLASPVDVPDFDVTDAVMDAISRRHPVSRRAAAVAWSRRILRTWLAPLLRCASLSLVCGTPVDGRVAVNVLDPSGGAWFGRARALA